MSYKDTRAWKILNPQARNAQQARYYASSVPGAFARGGNWTEDEDRAVMAQVTSDKVLAAKIGRTIRSIQNRRYRLKEDERADRFVTDEP